MFRIVLKRLFSDVCALFFAAEAAQVAFYRSLTQPAEKMGTGNQRLIAVGIKSNEKILDR
jgi:hypothetical protein